MSVTVCPHLVQCNYELLTHLRAYNPVVSSVHFLIGRNLGHLCHYCWVITALNLEGFVKGVEGGLDENQ